eukprot:12152297-Alexandrium_andersonii.AAC.1
MEVAREAATHVTGRIVLASAGPCCSNRAGGLSAASGDVRHVRLVELSRGASGAGERAQTRTDSAVNSAKLRSTRASEKPRAAYALKSARTPNMYTQARAGLRPTWPCPIHQRI